jgi:hypothetical protein
VFIPGGLDRIRIFRRDDAANTCVWMTLAWPGGVSQYDVEVTGANEWTVEGVSRNDDASSCDGDFPGSIEDIPVPDATGEAILSGEDPSGLPCEVGVDVTLQLVPNPDPPAYVSLCAQSLDLGLCE